MSGEQSVEIGAGDACVIWIEVEGRQRYLFETDKLREMLGASRIIASTVEEANVRFPPPFEVFQAVSGEIGVWAPATKKASLVKAAWEFGGWLEGLGVACTTVYLETHSAHFLLNDHDLKNQVIKEIKRKARQARDGRSRLDASPHCALFAPCRIHGLEYATNWNPGHKEEQRRQLTGTRAAAKLNAWESEKKTLYKDELEAPTRERFETLGVRMDRAIDFTDLSDVGANAAAGQDQFIAFICADGDGLGHVLQKIDWNKDWNDGLTPAARNRRFALELDELQRRAFRKAVADNVLPDVLSAERADDIKKMDKPVVDLPMLPQLMGGDDLWAVVRRDLALPFACTFADEFAKFTKDTKDKKDTEASREGDFAVVHRALKHAEVPSLSISMGIAFAKAGHPAHAMIAAAESLLRNAKKLRKGEHPGRPGANEACLDWHWIESSVSEEVADARQESLCYSESVNGHLRSFSLTTRPWTLTQTRAALTAAQEFKAVARRKREQLEPILRQGLEVSRLQWEGWWKGLTTEERKVVVGLRATLASLGIFGQPAVAGFPSDFYWPWFEERDGQPFTTPFLDLLALADPTASKGDLVSEKKR